MGLFSKKNDDVLAPDKVQTLPSFMDKKKGEKPEGETMSLMEKAAIRERTTGMTEEQKKITLMYMPAEMLFQELERRDMVAKGCLADLRDKLYDIRSNMSLDEMTDLIMEVREIARKGGVEHGT